MRDGAVEPTRYPRNPLDVLAQQLVAMACMDTWPVDHLFDDGASRGAVRRAVAQHLRGRARHARGPLRGRRVRRAAAAARPGIASRHGGRLARARSRVAVVNGGTIPDRGLYGVFLSRRRKARSARVGELDEEMVFETQRRRDLRAGRIDAGASRRSRTTACWFRRRPGEPGKMPFWHGDRAGRPLELGQRIGRSRASCARSRGRRLCRGSRQEHDLDGRAASELCTYLDDQFAAMRAVPDDRTLVIERVHATSWATGACACCRRSAARCMRRGRWPCRRASRASSVSTSKPCGPTTASWSACPTSDAPPERGPALAAARGDRRRLVIRELGDTALFAATFREEAARALLLPRRRPGGRTPLWQQRKRAADLLAVASRFRLFRCCSRPIANACATSSTCRRSSPCWRILRGATIAVVTVTSDRPSPFASALLFGYVANYIYDGDAPLAERRAQALAIDQAQLRRAARRSGAARASRCRRDRADRRGDPAARSRLSRQGAGRAPRLAAPTRRSFRSTKSCGRCDRRGRRHRVVDRARARRSRRAAHDCCRTALRRRRGRGSLSRRARRAFAAGIAEGAARARARPTRGSRRCAMRAPTGPSRPQSSPRASASASPLRTPC